MGVVWLCSAGFFLTFGIKYGEQIGNGTDGCLYGICNVVMAFLGGGIGFLLLSHQYPVFVLTSCLGSIAAPGFTSAYIIARTRSR